MSGSDEAASRRGGSIPPKKRRHINIPVFIPHLGCPNDCVFCNQRAISGHMTFEMSDAVRDIDTAIASLPPNADAEIAFFGGSFTGIDRSLMTGLLDIAESKVRAGYVSSIRLSTRPDYIDAEIIAILRRYSVKTIELGIQSMNDTVLAASKRGHTSAQSEIACSLVLDGGFSLVGQMMVGLPLSTSDDEIETAKRICSMGACGARIYPTVVLCHTALADMSAAGSYAPLTPEEGARRASLPLEVFADHGVEVLRVGLCATDTLSGGGDVLGGAYHPALGEMAAGELYLRRIRHAVGEYCRNGLSGDIAGALKGKTLTVFCAPGETSKVSGQHKCVKTALMREYNVKKVKVIEKNDICEYNISITISDG